MGVDARGFPGGLLRLNPAFAYVEPPSSWPLPWAERLMPAPNSRGTIDQIANIRWIIQKASEFQKNICFGFIDYAKAFDCVDQSKL